MKRRSPVFIPLLCVHLLSGFVFANEENLAINPSFEQAAAEGLPVEDWVIRDGIPVERRDDGGRTGKSYMRFLDDNPEGGQFLECRRVPARAGGTYTASVWLRSGDSCRPGVYLNFYDLNGQRIANRFKRSTGKTKEWTQVEVVEVAPENAWEVTLSIYAYIGDVGTFDADDAELRVEGGDEPGSAGLTRIEPGDKNTYEIGNRRELFVDDFLIDGLGGSAERRLHHPAPQEIVLKLDKPWEGETSAYFSLVKDEDRYLLYYRGYAGTGSAGQVCCVAESTDGIHFTRIEAGLFEFEGSKANNIVWKGVGGHNFTPFRDPNPAAPADERFKAMGYSHQGKGLGVFASPDGIQWRELLDRPAIVDGAFDSQNVAFYDTERELYVDFHRKGRNGVRDIMTCTSKDFRTWTDPVFLEYNDNRLEHLYTNGIRPYPRAPHLYLGFPARFVPTRTKVADRKDPGVSDALLMSSRDGLHFDRWSQAFIRPSLEPEVWTDRNNFPAWGLAETAPGEWSIYWTEHYRHPAMRLRRGTIRTDGFVSLHSEGAPGEMLTRPMVFAGAQLQVNYATDATGWMRFELCDEEGKPIEGFAFYDSAVLFGNEIEGKVSWKSDADLAVLAGRPVRLRIQMENADLYSFRFID
jgi:hypothetical protein